MKAKQFILFVLSAAIGLTVALGGCSPAVPTSDMTPMTPEEVVEHFYNWYLGYIADHSFGEPHHPLLDGAYRSSQYLTDTFILQVDESLTLSDWTTYDPFLCAQWVPDCITVDKAVISDEEADVIVHEIWGGGMLTQDVKVTLQPVDGRWKISSVSKPTSAVKTSTQTVGSFPE